MAQQLKKYFEQLESLINKPDEFNTVSMGMSNDFEEAVKFGATSVRIGSLFFGARKH